MPIYEYHCNECGRTYEMVQPSYAEKTMKCVHDGCNGLAERILSVPAKGKNTKGSSAHSHCNPKLVGILMPVASIAIPISVGRRSRGMPKFSRN